MNPIIPDWLTKEYIKTALEYGKDYSVTVLDIEIKKPVPEGTNYMSEIFQTKIEFSKSNNPNNTNKISLIVKSPIKGPAYESMLESGFLKKEISVYNDLSPKLKDVFGYSDETFSNAYDERNDDYILPYSYFSTEEFVLVFEDLKEKGYKMADRFLQLDFDHCVLAFKALAKFHAGSVIIHEKEPEFIEKTVGYETALNNGSEFNSHIRSFMTSSCKLLSEALENIPDLKKYSSWFEENVENIWNIVINSLKCDENGLNVLNHGDFSTSNMMFKYNEDNKPVKVKLIDFQLTRYTSPVIDFMYFVEASLQEKVKYENIDELIKVYLDELNLNLSICGSDKRMNEFEFKKILNDRAGFRIYVLLIVLPFVIADPKITELLDPRETTIDDAAAVEKNPIKGYYRNPRYIKLITKSLEEFEKMGIISTK